MNLHQVPVYIRPIQSEIQNHLYDKSSSFIARINKNLLRMNLHQVPEYIRQIQSQIQTNTMIIQVN